MRICSRCIFARFCSEHFFNKEGICNFGQILTKQRKNKEFGPSVLEQRMLNI